MTIVDSVLAELVAIPSFVNDTTNEIVIMEWIEAWIQSNLPDMPCMRSLLPDGRFNLYIGAARPRLLFVGHTDTVPLTDGWVTDPLQLVNQNNRLYGLGAADMKGSVAALLAALQDVTPDERTTAGVLLYVDEEYEFAGMGQIVRENPFKDYEPDLVISLDGNLEILAGCRGLIKLDMEVVGKSGHASNPANGVNVITNLAESLAALNGALKTYSSNAHGNTTLNVAYLQAGAVADTSEPRDISRAGNVIPNYADCTIELRVADSDLTPTVVKQILQDEFTKRGLTLQSYDAGIDLGAWNQEKARWAEDLLHDSYDEANITMQYDDPKYRGYIDVQMMTRIVKSPIYVIGAGGNNRHGPNEYTTLANLTSAQKIYRSLILRMQCNPL